MLGSVLYKIAPVSEPVLTFRKRVAKNLSGNSAKHANWAVCMPCMKVAKVWVSKRD